MRGGAEGNDRGSIVSLMRALAEKACLPFCLHLVKAMYRALSCLSA
jgi:hypothetical protein